MATTGVRREDRWILVVMGILCLLLAALAVLLVANTRRTNRLLLEYEVERVAARVLEEYLQSDSIRAELMVGPVLGVGVFDETGASVWTRGDVPSSVSLVFRHRELPRFDYDRTNRSVTLTRPLQLLRMPEQRMMPGRQMARARDFSLVVRVDASEYYRRHAWIGVALFAAPLFVVALFVLFGVMYARYRTQRRALIQREQLARLGETARTLAHEIKNPLNAIGLRARVLRGVVPPGGVADVEAIETEVARLQRLTDRIGEFLRDPLGSPEPIDLAGACDDVVARNGWAVEIQHDSGDNLTVAFDRLRLVSVLENVLRNAAEANEAVPAAQPVYVGFSRDGEYVVVSVRDHGNGFPPEYRERAFDPFYTTKPSGSGIGLSVVHRFVTAAKGTVQIVAREPGTEVRIRLPRIAR